MRGKMEKILVVNGSKDLVGEKVKTAIGERHQVAAASGEEKALELISNDRFDLLIAQVRPPELRGLPLAEAARKRDPCIALVLVGDSPSLEAASRRLKSGPQAFLPRLFSASELERAVEDALERRRLLRDNRRLRALLPLLEISKALMSEVELGRLFDVILEIVWRETEADSICLMLLDEAKQELVVKAALDPWGRLKDGRERVWEGIARWVAKRAEPLLLSRDKAMDPRLSREMEQMGAASVLCLPLVISGRVIGVLSGGKRGGPPFTQSDLELLSILCGQAAIAIENAILFSGVRAQQTRVEQLLEQTILAQEHERRRISVEIHDGAAQWMVGASYRIQALDKILAKYNVCQSRTELSEIKGVIDQSIKELRRVIFDLQPPALSELGFLGALRQNLENFQQDTGIVCSLQIEGAPRALSPLYEVALYRVTQEALTNVRKHAQATRVEVSLNFGGDGLHLEIRDDGKGFDLSQVLDTAKETGRLGLLGMRDRAETLGGILSIDTAEGAGTRVALTLPPHAAVAEELCPIGKDA